MDPLNARAHLQCWILDTVGDKITIQGKLFDDTTFVLTLPEWQVKPVQNDPAQRAWIEVEYLGRNKDRVAIVLPAPITDKGANISVKFEHIDRSAQIIKSMKAR